MQPLQPPPNKQGKYRCNKHHCAYDNPLAVSRDSTKGKILWFCSNRAEKNRACVRAASVLVTMVSNRSERLRCVGLSDTKTNRQERFQPIIGWW